MTVFSKIPQFVKIGWKQYFVRKATPVLNDGHELYGQINYSDETITLRECNSPQQDEATLVHELVHGISEHYGLDLEEHTVEVLANGIYTMLCDNGMKITVNEDSR